MQNYFAANLGATERLFHLSQKSSVLGYTQMVHYVDIHLQLFSIVKNLRRRHQFVVSITI
jgi:hypothetical protein